MLMLVEKVQLAPMSVFSHIVLSFAYMKQYIAYYTDCIIRLQIIHTAYAFMLKDTVFSKLSDIRNYLSHYTSINLWFKLMI